MHDHTHETGEEVHAHRPGSPLQQELVTHLPLSVAGAALGLALAGLICFLTPPPPNDAPTAAAVEEREHDHGEHEQLDDDHREAESADAHQAAGHEGHDHVGGYRPLFHLFHPLHVLFSAAATTAMFWHYDRRLIRAIIVGLIGSLGVCGISDIFLPQVSLIVLGHAQPWHVCLIEHPALVIPFAVMGVVLGLVSAAGVARSTLFSHSLHVFVSTLASIFYIINAYDHLAWIGQVGWIFIFVVIAVVFPCCFSDIVFPVAMTKRGRAEYMQHACCH